MYCKRLLTIFICFIGQLSHDKVQTTKLESIVKNNLPLFNLITNM